MNIQFKSLHLQSFKNHDSLEIAFGETTSITGKNGAGKSSVGESVTWLLFSTDTFGVKLEPKPIGNEDATTKVELLISVDGKDILLGREQKKTAKYFINEVPKKAKEFEAFVAELFNKNLFLSLFNPNYFSSQHWQDQREQLLSYVPEPLNKEVLAGMFEIEVQLLESELKKRSLEDIEKIHKERKNKHDKAIERANERVLTMKEQYETQKAAIGALNVEEIEAEVVALQTERTSFDEAIRDSQEEQKRYTSLQYTLQGLEQEIKSHKQIMAAVKAEKPQETCRTCGQSLPEEAKQNVHKDRVNRFNQAKEMGKGALGKFNELKAQLEEMKPKEVDFSRAREIDERIAELNASWRQVKQLEAMQLEIQDAEKSAETIRKERNESIGFLDAVKAFRAKRSELMVQKVKSLFSTIDVKLYETLKNGEERATFEITQNDKSYSRLSTAEKIRAGLEVVAALFKQAELIIPCFIDNAESILYFEKPAGQVIVARVADGNFSVSVGDVRKVRKVITKTVNSEYGEYGRISIALDGKKMFDVYHSDSPEDNNLGRNFSDCYSVPELMEQAYTAGKAGEVLEFVYGDEEEEGDEE